MFLTHFHRKSDSPGGVPLFPGIHMHFHMLNYILAIHAVDYTRDGRVRTHLQTGNSLLLSVLGGSHQIFPGNNLNRQWVSSLQPIDRGFCPLRPRKVNSTLLPRSTQGIGVCAFTGFARGMVHCQIPAQVIAVVWFLGQTLIGPLPQQE